MPLDVTGVTGSVTGHANLQVADCACFVTGVTGVTHGFVNARVRVHAGAGAHGRAHPHAIRRARLSHLSPLSLSEKKEGFTLLRVSGLIRHTRHTPFSQAKPEIFRIALFWCIPSDFRVLPSFAACGYGEAHCFRGLAVHGMSSQAHRFGVIRQLLARETPALTGLRAVNRLRAGVKVAA